MTELYTKEFLLTKTTNEITGVLNLAMIILEGKQTIDETRDTVEHLIADLTDRLDALDSIDELLRLQAKFFD